MAKSRKGGYKLVSLQLVELTTMIALVGLYSAIVNSHDKPLLISDILINGERKNNVYCRVEKGTNKYTIKNVYGYDIEVTNQDVVEVTENADGIELPKPTPEDDGSIVGVNVQGKYVLKPNPLPEVTVADNGKVLEVIGGAWGKGTDKVNAMTAEEFTALSAEEKYNLAKQGLFINGILSELTNPIFLPCSFNDPRNWGIVIGSQSGETVFRQYSYSNSVFTIDNGQILNLKANSKKIVIYGKALPSNPSDTGTFTLKCVNGVLTWVQDQ